MIVLGKINAFLHLNRRDYKCKFHVRHSSAYNAIVGRDFLEKLRE